MRVPTLGNANATDTLTVVTNPTCSLCARAHLEIEALMAGLEDVRCQFIITVSQRPGDIGGAVANHVLNQSEKEMPLALHEWYTTPSVKDWLKKGSPLNPTRESDSQAQVTLHQRWCELAGINVTPTIFFNGIEIPRHYTIYEIRKIVSILNEKVAMPA